MERRWWRAHSQLGWSQLFRLSSKQGNSLPGKTSSNSSSEFVFHSKVIAKETVKQCRRQQLLSQVWPRGMITRECHKKSKASSLSPSGWISFMVWWADSLQHWSKFVHAASGLITAERKGQMLCPAAFLTCFATSNKSSYLSGQSFAESPRNLCVGTGGSRRSGSLSAIN